MISPGLYLRRNSTRALVMVLTVAIGVGSNVLVSSVFSSFGYTRSRMNQFRTDLVEVISPPYAGDLDLLTSAWGAETLLSGSGLTLMYRMVGTAEAGFRVYGFSKSDQLEIVRRLGLQLSEGRLPEAPFEVVLPRSMLKALDLSMGSTLEERGDCASRGDYHAVGAFDGEP